ncbi:hypothetical protein [Enterococcus sp. DIV0086]
MKTITADLNPIYKASTEELALESLSEFDEKWSKKISDYHKKLDG